MFPKWFLVGWAAFGLCVLGAGSAHAQLPIGFDPCRPFPGENSVAFLPLDPEQQARVDEGELVARTLDFARTCEDDIFGPGILISGASSATHASLIELFTFDTPSDISSDAVQDIGIALTDLEIYDDISILPDGNLVRVSLLEKPRLTEIVFEGNEALTTSELQKISAYTPFEVFDRDMVIEKGRLVLEAYRAEGYFDAGIVPAAESTATFDAPNGVSVLFTVDEGALAPLRVVFDGNDKITDETLRALSGAVQAGTVNNLDEDLIKRDQEKIYQAYVDAGMERSAISVSIETVGADGEVAGEDNPPAAIVVTYLIDEKEGFSVGNVGVQDQAADPTVAGASTGALDSGEEFDPEKAQQAAQELAENLNEESDKDLGVRTQFDIDEDTGKVDVTFVVFEVPPREVVSVRFTGNDQTADAYLASLFAIPVGSKVSNKELVAGAQRIANTGLFENVSLEEDPSADGKVAVIVVIEESKTGTQRIGAALSSLYGFSVNGGIEERNWLGYGLYAGVSFDFSEDRQSITGFLNDSTFQGTDISFGSGFTLSREFNDSLDYANYSLGLNASLSEQINELTSHSGSIALTFNQVEEVGANANALAQAIEGRLDTSLSLGYNWNYGRIESNDAPYAGETLTARASLSVSDNIDPYLSMGATGAKYWSLNEENTFVFSTRASLDYVTVLDGPGVPLGGRLLDPTVKVRGFAPGGIAPRETSGAAIGGTAAFGSSAQLRYRLINNERFPVYGTAFVDAGVVFDEGSNFTLNANGTPVSVLDTYDLRWSAGVGLTLVTSGGTITLSYAEPLDSQTYDEVEEFQFLLGTNF